MTKTSASGHDTKHVRIAKNHCFACGPDNPDGMHLKFRFDERGGRAWCRFRLPLRFQGPPGHAHGGIIATILDEAMGKVNKLRSVIAVTKTMDVEYLKLVPLRKSLIVEGRERSLRGRKHVNVAEILNEKGRSWRAAAGCSSPSTQPGCSPNTFAPASAPGLLRTLPCCERSGAK
jgi:Uncharacterized protein, possibly involved in aromatic compounds catabolism